MVITFDVIVNVLIRNSVHLIILSLIDFCASALYKFGAKCFSWAKCAGVPSNFGQPFC